MLPVTIWTLFVLISFTTIFVNGTTTLSVSTVPPVLPQCGGCQALRRRDSWSLLPTFRENICTQTLTCSTPFSDNWAEITVEFVKSGSENIHRIGNNTKIASIDLNCDNGSWYLPDKRQITNIYTCQTYARVYTTTSTPRSITLLPSTPLRMSTSTMLPFTFTTTPKNILSTRTTIPYTLTSTVPVLTKCNKGGFQQLSAAADPSILNLGTFAGYFKTRVACQKFCNQNYQERCHGYIYEPQNRGTCTIFQYTFNSKIIEKQNSKISVFKKCNAPTVTTTTTPTLLSGKCCNTLVQSFWPPTYNADGLMLFTYNDEKCRSTATITCGKLPGQGLKSAAIVVLQNDYHKYVMNGSLVGDNTISYQAECYNGRWQTSNPTLMVSSIRCRIMDPPYGYLK
jgi:hypothetical protein